MITTRILSLNYGIVQLPYLEYNNPPKIYFQSELFDGVLENNVLIITLKIQVEKEEDAIELVKPFIRAWEIHASLTRGADELKFIFNGSTSKEIDSDSVSS